MNNKRIGGTLSNWCIFNNRVIGTITNDSNYPNGKDIITSTIVSISEDSKTLETLNTIYTLNNKVNKE